MLFSRLLLLCSLFCLKACVFTPLYYQSSSKNTQFVISTIREREGQYLRNLLIEKLRFVPHDRSTCYYIDVALVTTEEAAGYNTDLTATMTRVTITATVDVKDQELNEISNFTTQIGDIYINALSTYAITKAQEDTENRILRSLASDISTKISVALKVKNAKRN